MSHYAQVKNGIVHQVIVAEQDFVNTLSDKEDWIQTSYNTIANSHPEGRPLRGNYAGIGYHYDKHHDVFYQQKPHNSWTLNSNTWTWEAPVPYPTDGKIYRWDEPTTSWVEFSNE